MITEEEIWSYLDGNLNAAARKAVEEAIAHNTETANRYNGILAMHKMLKAQEAETPSVAFIENIMRSIQAAPQYVPASKVSIMPVIVFSIPLILLAIASCFLLANGGADSPVAWFNFNTINSLKMYVMVADIVLLFVFLDTLFYSKPSRIFAAKS